VIAGVVSYMLLCWGGGFGGLVSLLSPGHSPYSPYSSEHLFSAVGLVCLQGFAMCACASV